MPSDIRAATISDLLIINSRCDNWRSVFGIENTVPRDHHRFTSVMSENYSRSCSCFRAIKTPLSRVAAHFHAMLSVQGAVALALMLFVLAEYSGSMPAIDKDKDRFLSNVNVSRKRRRAWHPPISNIRYRKIFFRAVFIFIFIRNDFNKSITYTELDIITLHYLHSNLLFAIFLLLNKLGL